MSALNVILGPQAVYIVTDGCYYRGTDHTVERWGAKTMTLPHISAAVATVGPAGLVHLLGDILYHRAGTLDELMESPAIATVAANAATLVASGVPTRILIAGIAGHGPAAWHFAGDGFERLDGNFITSPTIEGWEPDWSGGFEAAMVDLVARQRAAYPVGGFVAMTTIDPGGISQKILHRFPDRIGDPIGPRQAGGGGVGGAR